MRTKELSLFEQFFMNIHLDLKKLQKTNCFAPKPSTSKYQVPYYKVCKIKY